ncbi:MAG: hypothetical protein K8H89_11285, partial [Flavobacteriales bacterium]|nr:hypothetical protein [Flavobacteriales bacterium]
MKNTGYRKLDGKLDQASHLIASVWACHYLRKKHRSMEQCFLHLLNKGMQEMQRPELRFGKA